MTSKIQKREGVIPLLWVLFLTSIFSVIAFGAEAWEAPVWLKPIVDMVMGLPYVGPFLIEAVKYVAVIAAVMTALSGGFMLVAKASDPRTDVLAIRRIHVYPTEPRHRQAVVRSREMPRGRDGGAVFGFRAWVKINAAKNGDHSINNVFGRVPLCRFA